LNPSIVNVNLRGTYQFILYQCKKLIVEVLTACNPDMKSLRQSCEKGVKDGDRSLAPKKLKASGHSVNRGAGPTAEGCWLQKPKTPENEKL
jgi:hypothetical protein